MTEEVKRKLTAILSADVKGYSRLMGEDEEGTLRTLNAYKEVMAGLLQQHRGRVVGTAGDSLLAEFASVVDAVQCAVEIQRELRTRNAELTEDRRMEFRIGINLGDVIEEGEQNYGDGVNIAARVQSLADGGGICISRVVYDQAKNKLSLGYEYLGEQTVKNIAEPVRVYRVQIETGEPSQVQVKAKDRHCADLGELCTEDSLELMHETQRATQILHRIFGAEGFNVGMNLGKVAGAGIAEHLHIHVVPRWMGDTNFMPVLADTKVMPDYLEATYEKLVPFFHEDRE